MGLCTVVRMSAAEYWKSYWNIGKAKDNSCLLATVALVHFDNTETLSSLLQVLALVLTAFNQG